MNVDDQDTARPPGDATATHLGRRNPAKLVGAAVAAIAGLGLLGHSLSRPRDERAPSSSAGNRAGQIEFLVADSDPPMAAGQRLFSARCARCHGQEGRGDGPEMANSRGKLRDLAASSWRAQADRAVVRHVILDGTPDHTMPGLGSNAISPHDLDSLVDYVLSLEVNGLLAKAGFGLNLGRPAPPLTFQDSLGINGSLEQFRGKLVLVAFWGVSCAPCLRELSELKSLADRYAEERFVVLPACVDETDAPTVQAVAAQHAPDLPTYLVVDDAVRTRFRISRLPHAVLIGRDARLLGSSSGERRWTEPAMENLLSACLGTEPTVASQPGTPD